MKSKFQLFLKFIINTIQNIRRSLAVFFIRRCPTPHTQCRIGPNSGKEQVLLWVVSITANCLLVPHSVYVDSCAERLSERDRSCSWTKSTAQIRWLDVKPLWPTANACIDLWVLMLSICSDWRIDVLTTVFTVFIDVFICGILHLIRIESINQMTWQFLLH